MCFYLKYFFILFLYVGVVPVCLGVIDLEGLQGRERESVYYCDTGLDAKIARYALLLKIGGIGERNVPLTIRKRVSELTKENALNAVAVQILNQYGNSFARGYMYEYVEYVEGAENKCFNFYVDADNNEFYIVNFTDKTVHQQDLSEVSSLPVVSGLDLNVTHRKKTESESKTVQAMQFTDYFKTMHKKSSIFFNKYLSQQSEKNHLPKDTGASVES